MTSPFARKLQFSSGGRTALALAIFASLLVGWMGCARHPLPELDLGDSQKPLQNKDAGTDEDDGDGEDEPADDVSTDDPVGGDGDGDGGPNTPPDDDPMTSPDPDPDPGVDPDDRTPSPSNFAGCPDTAPKPGLAACVLDQAINCVYGESYRCWCAFAAWICSD